MRILASFYPVGISDDVFLQLSSATSGGPVCPQLQHLTWTSTLGWKPMRLFLSPRLVSVNFVDDGVKRGDMALITTISLLPTTYLEDLDLRIYYPPSTPIHSVLSEVVQRLGPRFKRLTTESSLSDAAWEHLASLPKLVSFEVFDTPRTEILKPLPHENAFPALKSMEIRVDNVHQYWSFLFPLLESSPLQKVTVVTYCIQDGNIPSQVTAAMLGAQLQRTIDTLIFEGFDPTNLTFLSHLGSFGSLKTLDCITACRWPGQCVSPLTDPDIEGLARGSPHLVTLSLGHECGDRHYHTTTKSMVSLSTHCLSLEDLFLPCDLTNISEDIKTESGESDPRLEIWSACKLSSLDFGVVVMPPPEDIEASEIAISALSHLFPQL